MNASSEQNLTAYLPPEGVVNGAAMIVCPGGGYVVLADHEGEPVAQWLNTLGVTAFVLRYRLAPQSRHPQMWEDAAQALRFVRSQAGEMGLNANRIGILGFSAGGHLASTLATHFDAGDADSPDPIERVSCRPDLAVLVYPVITLQEPFAHLGSRHNLLGEAADPASVEDLSNHLRVSAQTPPCFLVHTAEDAGVPPENSLLMALALSAARVPFELHIYERGPHGFGLGGDDPILSDWPTRCAAWMTARGFLDGRNPVP